MYYVWLHIQVMPGTAIRPNEPDPVVFKIQKLPATRSCILFSYAASGHPSFRILPDLSFFTTLTPNFMHPKTGVRRRSALSASYKKPSPPPPYGDNLASPEANTLSDSATAHRIHALAKDVFAGAVPSALEEWINGRSREELSSLLARANELIRERERG